MRHFYFGNATLHHVQQKEISILVDHNDLEYFVIHDIGNMIVLRSLSVVERELSSKCEAIKPIFLNESLILKCLTGLPRYTSTEHKRMKLLNNWIKFNI